MRRESSVPRDGQHFGCVVVVEYGGAPRRGFTAGTAVSRGCGSGEPDRRIEQGQQPFFVRRAEHAKRCTNGRSRCFRFTRRTGGRERWKTQAGRKRIWLTLRRDCIQCRTMWTWWWGRRSIRPQAEVAAVAERRNELGQGAERTTGEAHSDG